jgi:hypothetical protein
VPAAHAAQPSTIPKTPSSLLIRPRTRPDYTRLDTHCILGRTGGGGKRAGAPRAESAAQRSFDRDSKLFGIANYFGPSRIRR